MKTRALDLADGIEPKHLITVSVAVVMTVLTLSYGGYGTDTLALLAVTCWTVILVGLGFGFLPRAKLTTTSWVILGLMAALTAWTALAISWSDDAGLAYIRTIQVATAFGICVVVILASRPGEGRAWIAGLTIGLGVIILLAAASRFVPVFGDDAALSRQLGPIMGGRLSWPLGYWNALGLATALFLVVSLWHTGRARAESVRTAATACIPLGALLLYLCASRGSIVAALIGAAIIIGVGPGRRTLVGSLFLGLIASVPLILIASTLHEVVHAGTGTDAKVQGAILLVVTALLCGSVAWTRARFLQRVDRANFKHRTALRVSLGVGAVALVVLIASNPVDRISSFTTIPVNGVERDNSTYATQHLLSESGNGRWQLWETSLNAFASEPVRGIGSGGFESYFKTNGSFWMKTINPHSTPLEFLAELGIIGFLLLAGAVGFAIYAGIRRYRDLGVRLNRSPDDEGGREELALFLALLAIGIFGLSIDWTGELPVISGFLMVCIAALAGPLYSAPARDRQPRRATPLRLAAVAASMLFAGAVIVASARQYEATSSISSSRSAIASGNGADAVKQAERAVSATPWAGSAYAQLAIAQQAAGDLPAALASAEEATKRSPRDDGYWLMLSNIQNRYHLKNAAVISALTARSLDPMSLYWTGQLGNDDTGNPADL